MASTRLVVQCSSRASGRQLHRSQRNVGPSASLLAPRGTCLHSSFARPSGIHGSSSTHGIGADISVLSALQNKSRDGSSSKGWTSWEIMASTMLAVAATGSFFVGTTVSSPSFSPDLYHRGGGGGGGGGGAKPGGSPLSPTPEEEEDESTELVTMEDGTGVPYQVSVRAVRGGRLTMEDEYFVADGGRFAAVFDGHGGGGVSALLKERLFKLTNDNLRRNDEFEEKRKCHRPPLSSYVAALRCAFEQIDQDVLMDDTLQYQGSTAVAVMVHEGDDGHRTLISANVGDSRAILSRRGRAVDLTRDHKPNDEREKARIMAMGETIEWDHYCKVHRVKNLSLSRAIGDRFAKPVVTGEVEIKRFPAADKGDEFFLLASDGLWDVMTSQDVVTFVHQRLNTTPKSGLLSHEDSETLRLARRQKMSSAVAKEALRRGSGDNVCVVIVWLNDDDSPTGST